MFEKKAEKSCFKPSKCLRRADSIRTTKVQKVHNFLKNYSQRKSTAFTHRHYYDFENPDNIIDNFLLNVRSRFAPLCWPRVIICKIYFKYEMRKRIEILMMKVI